MKAGSGFKSCEEQLRTFALSYPETYEEFPWGERAIKVKGKVFLFMRCDESGLGLSTKLPSSSDVALMFPFAKPTGYGLAKAGWVSASFSKGDKPPIKLLCEWIDESYRAIAPKKLAQAIGARATPTERTRPAAKPAKSTTKNKPAKSPARTATTKKRATKSK